MKQFTLNVVNKHKSIGILSFKIILCVTLFLKPVLTFYCQTFKNWNEKKKTEYNKLLLKNCIKKKIK